MRFPISLTETAPTIIRLPFGDKDHARLEAQVRNGILALLDITCKVHGPNTSLDAVVIERTPDQIVIELQACCGECALRGEKSILLCAAR